MIYILLTLTAFFWGLNFHLAQLVLKIFPPYTYATLRFSFAAFCLGILLLVSKNQWNKELFVKKWWAYFILAAIGIYGYNVFFVEAIQKTSASNAALIQAFNPMMTGVLGYLIIGQKLSKQQIGAMILSLIGVFIILTKADLEIIKKLNFASGDLLMLIVSLTFAIFNILNIKWLSNSSHLMTASMTTLFSCILFIFTAMPEFPTVSWTEITLYSWFIMFVMSFGGSVLASIWWVKGVNEIGAAPASIFMNLVPVFVVLIAVYIGQEITFSQIIGGLLVISGVFLSSVYKIVQARIQKKS